jgi:hypothetical protein
MKLSSYSRVAAFAALALSACAALAHHSFAMFDNDNQIKLKGTVANFQWTNPHVYIDLMVKGDDGKEKHWSIECANPGILNRAGWKFNMIKKGDELKVVVAALRSGEPGALLKEVVLPDGRVMGNGGPAGPANIHWDK